MPPLEVKMAAEHESTERLIAALQAGVMPIYCAQCGERRAGIIHVCLRAPAGPQEV